ncbi:MAG: hypothetical protein KBE65_14410 [Phycisphaerae bacterium]|nr:hypothetical protein [Phycisphaerae bacterium]
MTWAQLLCAVRGLDRKFPWSFVGVVFAVLFGVITIYGQFLADSHPHLKYEILANAPVLDVREDVSKLSVLFDGVDIRKQKESLRVMNIRIINDSKKDILKGYYDPNDPLGLSLSAGKMIRADLLDASNSYLEKQLTPRQSSDSTLSFPGVVLEAGEFFTIKVLVLHPESTSPEIRPLGKIAGIRSIQVSEVYRREPSPSLLRRAFSGDILTQIVRLLSYAILVIATLILLLAIAVADLGSKVTNRRAAKQRKKLLGEFKQQTKMEVLPEDELLLHDVLCGKDPYQGERLLLSLLSFMSDQQKLESNYAMAMQEVKAKQEAEARLERWREEHRNQVEPENPKPSPAEEAAALFRLYIPHYLKRGLILETEKGPAVNKRMREVLRAFVKFLHKKGHFENSSAAAISTEPDTRKPAGSVDSTN